jgi:ABC-type dipeptide/oligopeptide/nickel transport system permease subunit
VLAVQRFIARSQGREQLSDRYISKGLAHVPTLPGLAILATVLAINLVGDRLRDTPDRRV